MLDHVGLLRVPPLTVHLEIYNQGCLGLPAWPFSPTQTFLKLLGGWVAIKILVTALSKQELQLLRSGGSFICVWQAIDKQLKRVVKVSK